MERLTGRDEKGNLTVEGKEVYAGYVYNAASYLEEYEDTGLTPEQIAELKERDTAKMCKQSIFDHDSITCACGSDMDKDVEFMFCPWCGQRLKKWEE